MEKVYFAHPMGLYYSLPELACVVELQKLGYIVVNPSNRTLCSRARKARNGSYLSCEDCREKVMKPIFYKTLSKCRSFAYLGTTCGVMCELAEAKTLNRNILRIDFKGLDNISVIREAA